MKKLLCLLFFLITISITSFAQINAGQPVDIITCDSDNDGFESFVLTTNDNYILNNLNPAEYEITYHLTQSDADQGINALPDPFTNFTNPQQIYSRIFEVGTGNYEVSNFILFVDSLNIDPSAREISTCEISGLEGIGQFDLTQFDNHFTSEDSSLSVHYFETFEDALNNTNEIPNPESYLNTTPYYQELFLRIESTATGCFYVEEYSLLFLEVNPINVVTPSPLVVCDSDNDGFAEFDLFSKNDEILSNNNSNWYIISYHETLVDAELFFNELPQNYTNTTAFNQTVYIRVSTILEQCYEIVSLDLSLENDCVYALPVDQSFCVDDPNATIEIDLTLEESNILNNQDPSGFTISYYNSEADADNVTNQISNPQQYLTIPGTITTLFVRVEDNLSNNYAIVQYTLIFNFPAVITFEESYTICDGNQITLNPSGNNGYTFLWNTGSTDPEITVTSAGIYSVVITDIDLGCTIEASTEVFVTQIPTLGQASQLVNCMPDGLFDLTSALPEILNGQDPNQFEIRYFNNPNYAAANTNPIADPANYIVDVPDGSAGVQGTIYVRVEDVNVIGDCSSISFFNFLIDDTCVFDFTCDEAPLNNGFCYTDYNQFEFIYTNTDGLPIQVTFNAGQVEFDYDSLVVLDSDGSTNLNSITPYGNNGDLSGLSFTSSGNSITITVDSDNSNACDYLNYTPIDFDINCIDLNAVPICNASLQTPQNGEIEVSENTELIWNAASGLVEGYTLSIGLTSGGTELVDNEDVGNVITYDIGVLDYEVTYYVTIIPYNSNGVAEACIEQSFTTRANPNQTVVCEDGLVNTTYCYNNFDTTEFSFQSSDGSPLTLFFNTGNIEVDYDELSIIDSDGTVMNPNLPYGNNGDFSGLTYTSTGSSITVQFNTDNTISCAGGNFCCPDEFDFDVFCTSSIGIIEVNAFTDDNTNSIFDTNEVNFSNGYFTYEANGDGMINTVNSSTGSFNIISQNETDIYEITFNLYDESAGCYDITTAVFNNISVTEGNTITVDFPVVEEQSCEDLSVYLINYWTPPRPGFSHENHLVLENLGFTTITSGTVEFTYDPLLVYNGVTSANPNYTITSTATGFTVDFVNLQPGDVEYIDISLTCPAFVELGDILTNTANYVTDSNDLVPSNNYSTLSELVVGSWDPNDKMEAHGPSVLYDQFAASDEWLYYTIRFQNLGTAAAEFIRIEDALDNQLDESSFQMLRSSHDYVVTRTERSLEWYFEDINLPAEQDDAEGSNGFVYFRIKPNPGYALGDIIPNTAAIFFDFNAPVITNRYETEFTDDALSISEFDFYGFNMYPNPAKDILNIKLNNITKANLSVYDIQGKLVLERSISDTQNLELNVSDLQSGMYFVKLNTATKEMVKKLIIE